MLAEEVEASIVEPEEDSRISGVGFIVFSLAYVATAKAQAILASEKDSIW